MSAESLIGSSFLALIGVLICLLPFLTRHTTHDVAREALDRKSRDELVTQYERVLSIIRDLDDDHIFGKLPDEIYRRERLRWTQRSIELLRELEPEVD
jgi:hypothetical protein